MTKERLHEAIMDLGWCKETTWEAIEKAADWGDIEELAFVIYCTTMSDVALAYIEYVLCQIDDEEDYVSESEWFDSQW